MDKEEIETEKKKKDLSPKILIQGEKDGLDDELALLIRNFKRFLKKESRNI